MDCKENIGRDHARSLRHRLLRILALAVIALTLATCSPWGSGGSPPSTPTNFGATGGALAATLSWDAVDGATSYNLYASQGSTVSAAAYDTRLSVGAPPHTTGGLTVGLEYAFVVTAVNAFGESAASAVATATARTYAVGDTGPAGGIVFYDKGSYSDGWRYLESAASDQSAGIGWGSESTATGATSTEIGAGKTNTETIVSVLGSGDYAAKLCSDLSLGGYDDWFLPSWNELSTMYELRSTIGGFSAAWYWSSTELSIKSAGFVSFGSDGSNGGLMKQTNVTLPVRAIREF
jgi:hypothetical protein